MQRYTREQMAARVAHDIPEGAYVNLGIGLPTMVANFLPKGRDIILHTENGLLGMGPAPEKGQEDADLINAGKQPVTALPGASFFHHADYALIKADRGDRWGNLVYRKTARNFGPIMAAAAKCAVAQVREIVPLGALDPEAVVTPGIFVQRVVAIDVPDALARPPAKA